MKKLIKVILILLVVVFLATRVFSTHEVKEWQKPMDRYFQVQAIDTVKTSRDLALQKLNDDAFDSEIEKEAKAVASVHATHIAIGTPYDEKFLPYLARWVKISRESGLKIWFRGNFAGWEGWFETPKIDGLTHIRSTTEFISKHPELFEDGDIFTACPECENGALGDPRQNGKTNEYREFLISEHNATQKAFKRIGRNVIINFNSMNGDVARLVMNPETTKKLGGVVTIDHYVSDPKQISKDVDQIAHSSGGKVVLGEFGAPIPDIHGEFSQQEQSQWTFEALSELASNNNLIGLNYWTGFDASTRLWEKDGQERLAAQTLRDFFKPKILSGLVQGPRESPIQGASVQVIEDPQARIVPSQTDGSGSFQVLSQKTKVGIIVSAKGYRRTTAQLSTNGQSAIVLLPTEISLLEKIRNFLGL